MSRREIQSERESETEHRDLMVEFTSVEPGYSDSPSPISEPPDITNWFSSYVYESFPMSSLVKESENQVDEFPVGEPDKENLNVPVAESKDHKSMNKRTKQISDRKLYESFPSEPPDLGNWFSSYVYESPMLDTSDGLELSVPGESECIIKETETETEKETTNVCPNELVSSSKVTDLSQSQFVLSEPPDVRNWFSSYEYQSPELSEFSSCEKDQLIIDESDTEEEHSSGIFRKTKSKQETISPGRSTLNDDKENIAANTVKEISSDDALAKEEKEESSLNQESLFCGSIQEPSFSLGVCWDSPKPQSPVKKKEASLHELNPKHIQDHAYSDRGMEKNSSVGLFDALAKAEKQEPLFCESIQEPSFSLGVSWDSPKPQSPVEKNEASLHELRPKHIQETISMSSSRQKSPRKAARESDNKENVQGESTGTGFVTMKKARIGEARDRSSMLKPNRGLLVDCSRNKELKNISREVDEDEKRKTKKRKVLGEMSNQQFSVTEEIAGKWHCPQKNKGKLAPPLKQLRLDAWIHKLV